MAVIVEEAAQFESWLRSRGIKALKCGECAFEGGLHKWQAIDIAALISRGVAYDDDTTGRFTNEEGTKMGAPRPVVTITCPNCAAMKFFNLENIPTMQDALRRSHQGG